MVIQQGSAFGADQLSGQRIGFAGRIRPAPDSESELGHLPYFRGDDRFMGIRDDLPAFGGVAHTLCFQERLVCPAIHRAAGILGAAKDAV